METVSVVVGAESGGSGRLKVVTCLLVATSVAACVPFPINMADEAAPLGQGNGRFDAVIAPPHIELVGSYGVADTTDAYVQFSTELYSAGVKQTLAHQPGSHAVALEAGALISNSYPDTDSLAGGRDTGGYLGITANRYSADFTFTAQLRHTVLDHHQQFSGGSGWDFTLTERFRQVSQLGLSARWHSKSGSYALKGGVSCFYGRDPLPFQSGLGESDFEDGGCLPLAGFSVYSGEVLPLNLL